VARIKDVGVILWLGLVVWAILHLVFYRSSAPHGPDMVGEEVSGFLVPLLISLAPAIGLAAIRGPLPRPFGSRKYAPLLVSIVAAACSIVIYIGCVLR
jgi:hypothetical protein